MRYELAKTLTLMTVIIVFIFYTAIKYKSIGYISVFDDGSRTQTGLFSAMFDTKDILADLKSLYFPQNLTSSTTTTSLNENWTNYNSKELGLALNYPNDFTLIDKENASIELIKGSISETGDISNEGIYISFKMRTYDAISLAEYVKKHAEAERTREGKKSISIINHIEVNNIKGYQYTVYNELPISYTFLPNGKNKYLLITSKLNDPKYQGYNDLLEKIIATLTVQIRV